VFTRRAHRALLDRLEATVDWYEMQGYAPQDVGGGRAVSGASVDRPYGLTVGVTFTFHGPDGDRVAEGALGNGYSIAGDALTGPAGRRARVAAVQRHLRGRDARAGAARGRPGRGDREIVDAIVAQLMGPMLVRLVEVKEVAPHVRLVDGQEVTPKGRRASRPDRLYSTGTPARRGALA
jgi:hypothetical protein